MSLETIEEELSFIIRNKKSEKDNLGSEKLYTEFEVSKRELSGDFQMQF